MRQLTDREIRSVQLRILDEVDRFCRANQIPYYLEGGSLIGAVRHNGYIPWDDDVDTMMFRADYDRFISLFNESHFDFHAYSLQSDPGYHLHFCKIADTRTLLREADLQVNDCDVGVNIDLFPIDPLPEELDADRLLRKLHRLDLLQFCKSFRMSALAKRPLRQQAQILLCKLLGAAISKRKLGEWQEKLAKAYCGAETSLCSEITCHFRQHLPRWNLTDFEVQDHLFEGRTYQIPRGYDHILREVFGNYMELPPRNERVPRHGFTAWETEQTDENGEAGNRCAGPRV